MLDSRILDWSTSGDDKSYAGSWLEGQNLMESEYQESEVIGTSLQPTISPIIYSQPETFGDKLNVASSFICDAALDFDAYNTPALHQWPLQPTISPIIYSQPETFGDKLNVASSFICDAALDFDAYNTPALHQWPLQPAHETVNRRSSNQWQFDQVFQSFVLCALIT
ncbi:hypothetical protein N7517_010573 [Penicillium concentricum]|uniref:Uncharacterized protein n=1 Tax=Penicillium concentricum TaxID=293559 RepID=A0A9W9RB13_9EURO|nr:uncharacterized protein N7517_010573 [Penicillium concentricum]KAJ5355964.1 hypothetical protein N7517_010573 [Penicillium concentricum]